MTDRTRQEMKMLACEFSELVHCVLPLAKQSADVYVSGYYSESDFPDETLN